MSNAKINITGDAVIQNSVVGLDSTITVSGMERRKTYVLGNLSLFDYSNIQFNKGFEIWVTGCAKLSGTANVNISFDSKTKPRTIPLIHYGCYSGSFSSVKFTGLVASCINPKPVYSDVLFSIAVESTCSHGTLTNIAFTTFLLHSIFWFV